MSAEDDDITEELLADAGKLTGLSLELLGLDPHPDDMTAEQRLQFDPEDLAEMAAVDPVDRHKAVGRTRLLAGLVWNSSSILIDQLFRDLGNLSSLEVVTPADIALLDDILARMETAGLSGDELVALDRAFHVGIAGILGNAVLARFVGTLFDQRINPYFRQLASYFENADSWREAVAEHREIRDAIAAGTGITKQRSCQVRERKLSAGSRITAPGGRISIAKP